MRTQYKIVQQAFDDKPLLSVKQYKFLINPLTEQIPATSAELLRETTHWLIEVGDFDKANKIAGEEDKGAILVASTSLMTGLPFGMARWYPAGLDGQVSVNFEMEYTSGKLFLNGVNEADRVVIIDDMISTGGTMLAMIEAIQLAQAEIVDIVSVAEKVDYAGVQRVENETGYRVKTLVKISVAGERSQVVE
ncbi:MAG: adenine phosphoribosyltransferase [Chloroflexi bacterium]|nr:adenine phosphoribosyltransferase [Chloroflexota bacterium]MBL7161020.1 adenine phosphoribosyltransferase [Anaerolineales bacterium]